MRKEVGRESEGWWGGEGQGVKWREGACLRSWETGRERMEKNRKEEQRKEGEILMRGEREDCLETGKGGGNERGLRGELVLGEE